MRRSLALFASVAVFSVLAFAESYQGRLVDSSCYQQQKSAAAACDPTSSTTTFTLVVADKAYKLDPMGDSKTAEALKNRADRAQDPTKPGSNQVIAKITGTPDGENLKVETVVLQ